MIPLRVGQIVLMKNSAISSQMMTATISYIHTDKVVNLCVIFPDGSSAGVTGVTVFQGVQEECEDGDCCFESTVKQAVDK